MMSSQLRVVCTYVEDSKMFRKNQFTKRAFIRTRKHILKDALHFRQAVGFHQDKTLCLY